MKIRNNIYKVTEAVFRHRLATIAATICLGGLVPTGGIMAQNVFEHWEGYHRQPLVNGMQQVHEHVYYYYVNSGSSVTLKLPFSGYDGTSQSTRTDEPAGYIRWYDYNTDKASSYLSKLYSNNSYMTTIYDASGNNRGLFFKNSAGGTTSPNLYTTGVSFKAPSSGWTGTTIACDVSKYTDYNTNNSSYIQREPTLQMRYIFHIKSTQDMANAIMNAASTDVEGVGRTFEDNKRIIFGAKDKAATMAIRVNQNINVDGMKYRFYPLNNYNSKSVYPKTESQKIKQSDFNTSQLYTANSLKWRVYNEALTKYCDILTNSTSQFLDISINSLNNATWYTVGGTSTTATPTDIGFDHSVYVVAYASYSSYYTNYYCPIANYEVVFQNAHPKTQDQILADGANTRSLSYLKSHYGDPVVNISFDDVNSNQTLAAPTKANNMSTFASPAELCSYGYVYPDLIDQAAPREWPLIHGEYGLFKSANVSGVSDNNLRTSGNQRMYSWNAPDYPQLYDRTHEINSKQYGYFLYVDASEESRQIAAANFEANLCSGSRLIFSAAATDFTSSSAAEQPQLLFRLYGIDRDVTTNEINDRRLIQSFSSGDFSNNVTTRQYGNWHQIFGEMTLQRSDAADNYNEFQIVIDNMCKSTNGADYAVDDIRIYLSSAKVDVLQNKPVCDDVKTGAVPSDNITLKIRADYDNLSGHLNYEDAGATAKTMFFRFCDANNNPVKIDYDGDRTVEEYGSVTIPIRYSATDSNFETINNRRYYTLANRHFDLPTGKSYYVSVAYPDDNGNPDKWADPTDVCSTYSPMFEIVKQSIMVTDANGNVVTTVRIKCDDSNTPNVSVNAKLETVDKVNGGKVVLSNVKFDWFFSQENATNDINSNGVLEALQRFRDAYPEATTLRSAKNRFTTADRNLLKEYIDNGRLLISASSSITTFSKFGRYEVAAIPIASSVDVGGQQYDICSAPLFFPLRIVKDGPRVYTGFSDVTYPSDDRTLRIGLPQINAIAKANAALTLPMASMEDADNVKLENSGKVWISSTNDPQMTLASGQDQFVGYVSSATISKYDKTFGIRFNSEAANRLREGYWYEINFSFNNTASSSTASCPGEVFIKMLIVPEYATWKPSQATNSAWNSDDNWIRSNKAEIYKNDYADYSETREAAYMPMKFTKVTVPTLTNSIYPNLGAITYKDNGIATRIGDVAYDIVTKWNYSTTDGSDTGNGNFSCEKWAGNFCDQIYFKPEAELLYANYLTYNKAYVEKELTPNTWSVMSSPLKQTYAGDLYVPKSNGQEQSEAFKPMTYDKTVNDRNAYPIFQRSWDGDVKEVMADATLYKANHDGTIEETTGNEITLNSAYWTHVYNKVDEAYSKGKAFVVKAGDKYTEGAKNNTSALIRLPKADTKYSYYDSESKQTIEASVAKNADNYRLQLGDNDQTLTLTQPLNQNVHEGNNFHLVGNPFTSSLSMYRFLKINTAFEGSVWTFADGKFTAHSIDTSLDYDKKKDVIIPPTQAFFVKVKDGENPTGVTFNSAMLINRWVSGGEKALIIRPTLTLTTTDGIRNSESKLIVNEEACRDYVVGEDVEMLGEGNIAEVAQVYSVAGSQAVALNASDDINWMPVGVVAAKSKEVDVNVSLNSKMLRKMDIEGSQLFLFDATTKTFSEIKDGMTVKMMANDHGRYYVTNQSSLNTTDINTIDCFSPTENTIVVATLKGDMKRVVVYDISGALVTSNHSVNGGRCQLNVPKAGIYVVKATTKEDRTETFKIVVR